MTFTPWLESAAQAVGVACLLVLGVYMAMTLVLSRWRRKPSAHRTDTVRFVIVVPARNEEIVIGATVESLLRLDHGCLTVLVMDDGSTDDTANVVAELARRDPRIQLVTRRMPKAGTGKGAVLNDAYSRIDRLAEASGWDRDRVLVGIVDADGLLPVDALAHVESEFHDPSVGGVQLQVRIRNRTQSWFARCQDYEFLTFSTLVQSARQHLGSVGLGGNGQFTRLSALDSVGPRPWTSCLTEDLDLGLRLVLEGWGNRFVSSSHVAQQGLVNLPRIIRQRTRWMQGHFQCWRHMAPLVRSSLPNRTALDLVWYLLAPGLTLLLSVLFGLPLLILVATVIARTAGGDGPRVDLAAALFYAASFGPAWLMSLIYRRQARDISWPRTVVLVHVLAIYNFVWYIATWRAVGRLAAGRTNWVKTERVNDEITTVSGAV